MLVFSCRVSNDADRIANSADPDLTALLGAVLSYCFAWSSLILLLCLEQSYLTALLGAVLSNSFA